MPRLRLPALFLTLAALLATSCSSYRLGTGSERDFATLFIPPVQVNGQVPQATAVLTTGLREAFNRDGRIRVVNTPEEADAVLTVSLTESSRRTLATLAGDTGMARKISYTLDARVTLAQPEAGGKTWFADRPVRVERRLFTDAGSAADPTPTTLRPVQQAQAEYQILPVLAEDLGTRLVGLVLDTW